MLDFKVLTLFPELTESVMNTSMMKRALEAGYIGFEAIDIRDFAENKNRRVDDYTYGGGAGMLMHAGPVFGAYEEAKKRCKGTAPRVVYLTPQGSVFDQKKAEELSKEEDIILLCGHYEGIDERVLEEIVTDNICIGDYVLTGGELPALVLIDAVARLVPGVLGNAGSSHDESFEDDLLEYPQYTRPEVWHDKKVPDVLLSGHHANITKWRREKRLERTKERRPDLYEKYLETLNED